MSELMKGKKKSEILVDYLASLHYGDVASHIYLSRLIDEEYGTQQYNTEMQKARKILLRDYNRSIENVRGVGYRVISPDNYVDDSLRHYKRGFKAMNKGANILKKAPVNEMSIEGRERYRRVYDRAIILEASMKGVSVELKTLGQKKHPMSIENVNR